METNKPAKTSAIESGYIDDILREQERLNQIIHQRFKKQATIVFTDICGYTRYTEAMGDIGSRSMLQRHNDIVLPIIEQYKGTVVKTIGDAVMAAFSEPIEAVKAAIAIQAGLCEHNRKTDDKNRIFLKIGINSGEVLEDRGDLFGDAVNVAARIQSQAGKEEILISRALFDRVRGSEDVLCRFYKTVEVKGKSEPLELYRVVWKEEDPVAVGETRLRSAGNRIRGEERQTVFHLDISRRGQDLLKISANEQGGDLESTIQHYEEISAPIDKISARCREMVETLNNANRQGRVTRDVLMRLRDIGRVFSDDLFTSSVKEKLSHTRAKQLVVTLDDQLVQVPWELIHVGNQFLCQRFSMGRIVRTRQPIPGVRQRMLARPLKMLILADPGGDLKGAYAEGVQLRDCVDRRQDLINASFRSGDVSAQFLREKIRNFDMLHYAGHFDYDPLRKELSGWKLTNGSLTAEDVMKMAGAGAMPSLIFSNACQSARTEEWSLKENFQDEIFGLANAFMLSGVNHYVGTFWEIQDELSSRFALVFYRHLLSGVSVGESLRLSRLELIREYGEEAIVWASYLLYGDPGFNYIGQIQEMEERKPSDETDSEDLSNAKIRSTPEVIEASSEKKPKKSRRWIWAAAAVLIVALLAAWGYPTLARRSMTNLKRQMETCYQQGDFEPALLAGKSLSEKYPKLRSPYLIQGDIYLRSGRPDMAEPAFRAALACPEGTPQEASGAYLGLGRIASIRNRTDEAVKLYQSAAEADPSSATAMISRGLLLDQTGNHQGALTCLKKAGQFVPNDSILSAVTREVASRVEYESSRSKQERIDRLLKELLERKEAPLPPAGWDGWTSRPLTLWMMDVGVQGYSVQEGQERMMQAGVCDRLLQSGRIRLVERQLLDKLLEELKIGSSKLADPGAAISLGKILAARLLVSGQVIHSGSQTQVSFRIIETETGRITAAVTESFGSLLPVSALSEKMSEQVLEKLEKVYPIRAVVSEIKDQGVILNIGQDVGVHAGQAFKAIDDRVRLEVVSVQPNRSIAKITTGNASVTAGQRLEAL